MSAKVIAIGIDAAEWSIVRSMAADGLLPNLQHLMAESARAELHADVPYRAEAVWTEFLTGRTPQESRYWTTATFDPATYEAWEWGAFRGVPFYARPDLRVVAFDIPHSVLAPEANGVQVTAWGAHSAQFPTASSPADLIGRIDREFGLHRAVDSDSHPGWNSDRYRTNLTDALVDGVERKVEICSRLADEVPDFDLFCVVFSETHVAGHHFIHGLLADHLLHDLPQARLAADSFRRVWRAVDEGVGKLTSVLNRGDTTFVVFAVHGMQTNGSDVTGGVLIPEVLHRLHTGRELIRFPAWSPSDPPIALDDSVTPFEYLSRYLTEPRGTMYGPKRPSLKRRLSFAARRRLPEPVYGRVERAARRVLDRTPTAWWEMQPRPPLRPSMEVGAPSRHRLDYQFCTWYAAYWPSMPWFVIPSYSDAHLRLNVTGREVQGMVDREDYTRTLDELEGLLSSLTDARTGEPVVADFFRVRERDPFDPEGPTADLVVSFRQASDAISHPELGVVGASPMLRSGEHSHRGWVLVRPPAGASGDLGVHRPRDIGPTIVDLLGRPASPLVTGASFAAGLHRW